jgi:hypothetical protein
METLKTEVKVITHRFIHSDGTDFLIIKPNDNEYRNFVEQMNQVEPHQGMVEDIEWKIKVNGDFKFSMEQMTALSQLVIVKEQITRKDRFGKKITLRNQECALYDMIRGCSEVNDNKKLSMYALCLVYIKPEARTFFGIEGIDFNLQK